MSEQKTKYSESRSALIEKHNSVQSGLKNEIKQLHGDLSLLKHEFVPPQIQMELHEQITSLQKE